MKQSEMVKLVAKLLKERFPNLSVSETIDLAYKIVEALDGDNETRFGH